MRPQITRRLKAQHAHPSLTLLIPRHLHRCHISTSLTNSMKMAGLKSQAPFVGEMRSFCIVCTNCPDSRSTSSSFTRKPSAWTRQSYFNNFPGLAEPSHANQKENVGFPETKRVPKAAAKDPTPKRRRTILRDVDAGLDQSHQNGDVSANFGDSMSLLQRSLMQHGVQIETPTTLHDTPLFFHHRHGR